MPKLQPVTPKQQAAILGNTLVAVRGVSPHLGACGFAGPYGEHGRLGNVLRYSKNRSQVMTPECNGRNVPTDAGSKHAATFDSNLNTCTWDQLAAHRGLNLAFFLAAHALSSTSSS